MSGADPNDIGALASMQAGDVLPDMPTNEQVGVHSSTDQSSNNRKETQAGRRGRSRGRRRSSGNEYDIKKHPKKATAGGGRVRNSYLKVVMDDDSVDLMHDMAQRIRQGVRERFPEIPKDEMDGKFEAAMSDKVGDNNNDADQPPPKQRRPPRPLTFKPRSRNSLHMTFFFGGTTICEIPPEELVEWHNQVMARLKLANTPIDDDKSGESEASRYSLQFRELCLFPPRRNTLIVAIFDGSTELHKLHDDLRNIAKESNSDGLKEVVKRSKERWTAHVTLGDLYGGGRGEAKEEKLNELTKMLQDGLGLEALKMQEDVVNPLNFTAKVKGIAMGGPVPPQVELNWDHWF